MGPFSSATNYNKSSWYKDVGQFTGSWFLRGRFFAGGVNAGIFGFNSSDGSADNTVSFRIVLTPNN